MWQAAATDPSRVESVVIETDGCLQHPIKPYELSHLSIFTGPQDAYNNARRSVDVILMVRYKRKYGRLQFQGNRLVSKANKC